jgi:tRNA(His) 5'-end guanylyltransferase
MTIQDKLGDYIKQFESVETSRVCPVGKPMIARLDGRAFHTFTRGLNRPFDERLTQLMRETTQFLVKETNALVGYCQSDEITLVWFLPADTESQYLFGGRIQKATSILASLASVEFNRNLAYLIPEKVSAFPIFDARVFSVPTLKDAFLSVLWRERDAIKNSITMFALSKFSHKQLQGVNGDQKKKMLSELGTPWEDLPLRHKRGSYFARVIKSRMLTEEEMIDIPVEFRPTGPVKRSFIEEMSIDSLENVAKKSDEEMIATLFPSLFIG